MVAVGRYIFCGFRHRNVRLYPVVLQILPVQFVWFDPEARRYRWQSSEPVTVRVVPDSTGGAGAAPVVAGGPAIAAPRRVPGPAGSLSLDPPRSSVAIFGGSALLFGAALLVGRSRRLRERDPRWRRLRAHGCWKRSRFAFGED